MAAQRVRIPEWTEGQLRFHARQNFNKNVGEMRMRHNQTVAHVTPFGLSDAGVPQDEIFQDAFLLGMVGLDDFGDGAGAGAGAGIVNDSLDDDFGQIRVGRAHASGNIVPTAADLRAEARRNEPPLRHAGEDDLDYAMRTMPQPPADLPDLLEWDPSHLNEDPDFGVEEAKEAEPAYGNIGYEINYANTRRMGRKAFGAQRRRFFYEQLRRMNEVMRENVGNYKGYSVAVSYTSNTENIGHAIARDFGTTAADGERRRPVDTSVWDYDIHDRMGNLTRNDFSTIDGPFVEVAHESQVEPAIELLIQKLEQNLLQENDSGGLETSTGKFHLLNLFLMKYLREAGGGEGRYDITDAPERICFSRKSVVEPERSPENMCFWECLVLFLHTRYEAGGKGLGRGYDSMLSNMHAKVALTKVNKRAKLKKCMKIHAPDLLKLYVDGTLENVESLKPIALYKIQPVLAFFECENEPLIMDCNGEAMCGEIEGAEKRRMEDDMMTLIWHDNHFYAVLSYTGSLMVKKCRRCDMRFTHEANLKKHLEGRKCMTCVCRAPRNPFESESEWRFHMETRADSCPKYRAACNASSDGSAVDENGKKLRFLNDARQNSYRSKKAAQDALERHHSVERNYEEAIFFDLETVVPLNASGVKCDDHEMQEPYACGWIKRSAALEDSEPLMTYGKDCMKEFVEWLDEEYEKHLTSEKIIWFERASEGVMIDPKPKKTRGFTNYAYRVKKSWDTYVKSLDTPACEMCGDLAETEHGYTKAGDAYTFSSCSRRIYARNTAESNMKLNFNNNAPRISVFAHNGGKFDWVFFHRYLMEVGKLDELVTVRNNSKYFQLMYKDMFELKDSIYFMMGSLDKLGKDFNVETLKGIFPYRLMSSMSKCTLVVEGEEAIRRDIPHKFFQIAEKISGPMGGAIKRDMNEEEYENFFSERGWVYDVEKETRMYLKDDVMCLFQVVEKFRQGWLEMPECPRLFEYCTIGQMCHSYFLKHYLEKDMYPCLDVCEDAYIRRALYGGRTEVFRRVAPPGLKIHYVDVNSLYPYVMEDRDLPCGDPVWHFRRDDPSVFEFVTSAMPVMTKMCDDTYFESLQAMLNESRGDTVYGFVEVDVLCNLNRRYPVLPERRSTDGGKTHKNMFTNMQKSRMVYYTEELKRAIRCGCVVTKVWSYSEWHRGRVYGPLIKVLKAQKLMGEGKDVNGERIPGVEKNPSLRAAAKVAQNSLFGKTIQFIDSGVQLVHTRERLYKALQNRLTKVTIKPVFRSAVSDVVEVTSKFVVPKVQKRSCAAIGTAILAEARLVLYDYFDEVLDVGGEILYCDTDSIVFAGNVPLPDDCMHDCHYGKMKVEIDPDTIEDGGFVGMSPKCYAFKLKNGDPYVRCKGVNLSKNLDMVPAEADAMEELLLEMENEEYLEELGVKKDADDIVTTGINFDKMKALIEGDIDALVTKQLQFLKTTDRHVSAYENVKMLRSHFDKRFLADEGITYPWNDFNMNMETILRDEDNRALSDYLNACMPEEIVYLRQLYGENDFFRGLFSNWLQSDSTNVLEYTHIVEMNN